MKIKWLLGLLLIGLLAWCQPVSPVHAASVNVLLAYDATDATEDRGENIAAVQRLLTSAGVRVRVQPISQYRSGELSAKRYTGVVTLINWPTVPIANTAFVKDRAAFTGTKLHIGSDLKAQEAATLGATATTLYRRQLLVQLDASTQLLPYQTDTMVLQSLPQGATAYGHYQVQGEATTYPAAVVKGNNGFIPYYDGEGISQLIATRVVARLFAATQQAYAPLLLIQGVTPYSNLTQLKALANHLYGQGIPFAISATSVAKNFDLLAFRRYAAALRVVEDAGGLIFLHMPAVGDPGTSGGPLLRNTLTSMVTGLAQRKVFAVGWTTPTYFNRDAVFRQYGLKQATTLIQLKDPSLVAYAKEDDHTGVYQRAYTIVSGQSLLEQKYGTPLANTDWTFALPTAVTFAMPASKQARLGLQKRIAQCHFSWQPTQAISGRIDIGMITTAYRNGQYYLNGQATDTEYQAGTTKPVSTKPGLSLVNRYFKFQGKLMWLFFAISLSVMALLLIVGRRVYLNMYKRK